jgi:hypothetical protein
MPTRKRVTLESWIKDAVTDDDKEGHITMLACVHISHGAERDEIHAVRFSGKTWTAKELARLFRGKAEAYAQNIPGMQGFALLAFYGGRDEAEAKHRFNVMGEGEYGDDGVGITEGPDAKGLLGQGMRHLEIATQTMMRQTAIVLDASNRTIAALTDQNEKLMRENHEALSVVKEIVMSQVQSQQEFKMKQMDHLRSTEERKKWLTFAPALINSLLGREVFPQSTADTSLVETIAEALSEKDIQQLAGSLPPHLWGPLATRFTSVLQTKRESQETQKQLIETTDPVAEAGGDPSN